MRYDLPQVASAKGLPAVGDAALTGALSGTGSSQLGEVVATIQPNQYEQIASTDKSVMIVQGAAGSGKSLVGLHRIAYLLSPFNTLQTRPRPRNVVMLRPSRAFLSYVRNLLPSLGQHDIQQVTVNDWMLSQFTRRPRIDRTNRLLNRLMSNKNPPTMEEMGTESFKGSMSMALLLDSYVKNLRRIKTSAVKIDSVQSPNGSVAVSSEVVRRLIRSTVDLPLNVAKKTFIARLVGELWGREYPTAAIQGTLDAFNTFENSVRGSVENQSSGYWPELDTTETYLNLLGDSDMLFTLSKGGVTDKLATSLRSSCPRAGRPFESTDVPALLYLDHLLNEHSAPEFEHVVIDEAQDVSPLEVHLIRLHSRNGWFTILGDLRQRTLPYTGLSGWQDLRVVFGIEYGAPFVSRLSYRSTGEITRFANRILRRVSGNTAPPIPYDRAGVRPKLHRSRSSEEMHKAIAARAQAGLDQRMTVGVMTRTTFDAKRTANYLHQLGLQPVRLTPDGEVASDLTVSPILLAKGLQFDIVIVVGVDADSFTGLDMDNRLLYLACTRARHFLEIHWSGTPSPLIVDLGASGTELGGELEGRRTKRSIFRRPMR